MPPSKPDLKAWSAVVGEAPELVGEWVNELGSAMTIHSAAGGLIVGNYRSSVSQKLDPTAGRLTGFVAGDAIGWVVNWEPRFTATTCWSGKLLAGPAGEPAIYTVWQLSGPMRSPSSWWESFLTGSDMFWRAGG